jgi:hypothetical protein
MMPRNPQMPHLSDGQAHYIMQRLVAEGRISPAEVTRCIGRVDREIRELESKLQRLKSIRQAPASSSGDGEPKRRRGRPRKDAQAATESAPAGKTTRRRRRAKRAVTPEGRASRQVQGRYLALIRQIPANRRSEYSKLAKEKDRETAIARMEATLRK